MTCLYHGINGCWRRAHYPSTWCGQCCPIMLRGTRPHETCCDERQLEALTKFEDAAEAGFLRRYGRPRPPMKAAP
jgi:hypothetical protein